MIRTHMSGLHEHGLGITYTPHLSQLRLSRRQGSEARPEARLVLIVLPCAGHIAVFPICFRDLDKVIEEEQEQ